MGSHSTVLLVMITIIVPTLFTMIDFGTHRTMAPTMLKRMIFLFAVGIATLALAGWSG